MNKGDFVLLYSLFLILIFQLNLWIALFFVVLGIFLFKKWYFLVVVLLVVFRLFFFLYNEHNPTFVPDEDTVYLLEAKICGEPDLRTSYVNYILCITKLTNNYSSSNVETLDESSVLQPIKNFNYRVLLKSNLYPEYRFGDTISFSAKFETPFETDEFSYKNYLKIFKVKYVLKAKSNLLFVSESNSLKKNLYLLKNFLLKKIESNFSEPYASLINGLLLGSRKGFSTEITEYLSITGLTHIVAVSGYNISLVILFVDKLFLFIPRNLRFYIIGIFLLLFAIITGLSASVVRATIMGVISIAVVQYGYSSNFVRSILLAAFLMALYNPITLLYDLGFQLSFFSTLGVVILSKKFNITFLPNFAGIRESFILTVASQIATLPTIVFYFGVLSIVAPIANVLVAPFLPILMLIGFLVIVFDFILPFKYFLILIADVLGYIFFIILEFLAKIPYASINLPIKNYLVLSIAMLFLILVYKRKSFD